MTQHRHPVDEVLRSSENGIHQTCLLFVMDLGLRRDDG